MAHWRAFTRVATLVALSAALLPATASAGPQWLPPQDPPLDVADAGPDVTADAEGNSAAIWVSSGTVRVAERPRGGAWGDPVDLDTGVPSEVPKITVLPDGQLVAMWVKAFSQVGAAQRPAGEGWTAPATINTSCCIEVLDVVAGENGTAMGLLYSGDGASQTVTLPPGSDTWGGPQVLANNGNGDRFMSLAVAPDGSAEVAIPASCGSAVLVPCIVAEHRPPGGNWGSDPAGPTVSGHVTGNALVANPDSTFSLVWGEDGLGGVGRSQTPDGAVRSSVRSTGLRQPWSAPDTVSSLVGQAPGCPNASGGCIDLAADGQGGLLAVWQQGNGDGKTANTIQSAFGAAGGGWGSPQTVEGVPASDALPRAAFTGNGIPVAVWRVGGGGPGTAISGAHLDENGAWAAEAINDPATLDGSVDFEDVVGDGEGNAVTGWRDQNGVGVAGFDGIGPSFSAFALPSGGAGQSLPFSAAADDNWSGPPAISWLFGDGGAADGSNVNHTYGSGGSFVATATAKDGAGNATEQSGPVAITGQATPTPTPTPTPDPCGTTDRDQDGINDACDDSDGAAAPRPFRTVNATVVSGDVFVKEPGGSASAAQAKPPKGFRRLEGAETIGVGSTLDTAKGVVMIRSAADTRRHTQIAKFSAGRFVIKQVRRPRSKRTGRRSNKLITDLRLTGSSFRRACRTSGSSRATTSARRRSRKRVRRLFGDGKGSFRTTGRNAAATVKGTRWGVQDRCDGTLITVRRGRVTVRDFVRKRTFTVRAPRRFLVRLR